MGNSGSMLARRDRLYVRYLAGESMTIKGIVEELGIGPTTASEDLQAVRARHNIEVISKAEAKATELLEAGIDMTEPSALSNAELLKFKTYAKPPVQKVKAEVTGTIYTGLLKMVRQEEPEDNKAEDSEEPTEE